MQFRIKKVAVLGSGVMGSGISCQLANVGLEVLMLDILPGKLSDDEKNNRLIRNQVAKNALDKAIKSKPAPLYNKKYSSRITVGNFEDDFHKIKEADWIIEVVVENRGFTKKELLKMSVKKDKLQRSLGGISEMKKVPDLVFIIDTNYESLAIQESVKLGIPIIAILDSNSNPDGIDYPIPGNDDARRAIDLYCNLIKETIISAKKVAPTIETKNLKEKKIDINKKSKTVAETDREKLDKKFSKKKEAKLN